MLSDKKQTPNTGFTKDDIATEEEIISIMEFIEKSLVDFKPSEPLKKETILTQLLVRLLESKKHPVWIFDKENVHYDDNSIEDIAVCTSTDLENAFFVIEAKRLNSKFPKDREKEYIIGKTGGIERFKRDNHGQNLKYAGMIGYIQSDDFDIWENKINDWIEEEIKTPSSNDLIWKKQDKLIKEKQTKKISKYISNHSRVSKKDIFLTHLWIKLN